MRPFKSIVAATFICLIFNSCHKDDYLSYNEQIIGNWYCHTTETISYVAFNGIGTYNELGYDLTSGWMKARGGYKIYNDKLVRQQFISESDYSLYSNTIKIDGKEMTVEAGSNQYYPNQKELVYHKISNNFDIRGEYSFEKALVDIEHKDGNTEITLPVGLSYQGKNTVKISDIINETNIKEFLSDFFRYIAIKDNWVFEHSLNGEDLTKEYLFSSNKFLINIAEVDSKAITTSIYSFPDKEEKRLFFIIKDDSIIGYLISLLQDENTGVEFTEEQFSQLKKTVPNHRDSNVNAIIVLKKIVI